MNKFDKLYNLLMEEILEEGAYGRKINLNAYSQKYINSLEKEQEDRTNWVHHFIKKIDKNPDLLNDFETVSMLANNYWYLPADKAKEYKPYIDKFYKSLKKG